MERIINLLQEKNHYLEKFYLLNESMIVDLADSQYEGLDSFYQNREKILSMLQYIDGQLNKSSDDLRFKSSIPAEAREQVETELKLKKQYSDKILDQDLKLISLIETAKSEIIEELLELKKGRKAVSQYKSPSFKKRLDEKL